MTSQTIYIEKRSAVALEIDEENHFKIIQAEGPQISVLLAFKGTQMTEHFSQCNTRISLGMGPYERPGLRGVIPFWIEQGDILISNQWDRMLTLKEDTYGTHDIIFDPCDSYLNVSVLGDKTVPTGCRELHAEALKRWGIPIHVIPAGINLFQNTVYTENGISVYPTKSKKGDYAIFRADTDLIISVSACPCPLGESRGIQLEIYD